jgi:hypothetical protein
LGTRIYHKRIESEIDVFIRDFKETNQLSPAHHIGYTIFFLGLYWIMLELQPTDIYLLGFDHDYNPKKTEK